ncbi:MAG: Mov34/MPN/PAD-1 family protein [Candidatus Thermoplasmatota archaeon]|nr:Mov34/MPN/PAD-1 family protein [Candidatus Thermoplasmatota archaeon]
MPGGFEGHLAEIERGCMDVRHGRLSLLTEEETYFLNDEGARGFLRRMLSGDREGLSPGSLFRLHDVLVLRGRYRRCIEPLERIASSGDLNGPVVRLALARAGNAALDHSIPLDMGPVVSALGLSERMAPNSRRRGGQNPLLIVESHLLASRLLVERSDHVESRMLARGMRDGMFRYLDTAYEAAEELSSFDEGVGAYHLIRCDLVHSQMRLDSGDPASARRIMGGALERAIEMEFPYLEVLALEELSRTAGSEEEGIGLLERAIESSARIDNDTEGRRAKVDMHELRCAMAESGTAEAKQDMVRNAHMMDEVSEGLSRDDPDSYIRARARSALWMARADDHRSGANVIREALKHLKKFPDDEIESVLLSTAVMVHLRSGNRSKGKRALLDLIARRPVKNYPEAYLILKEAVSEHEWLRTDPDTSELFEDEMDYSIDRSAVEEIVRRAKDAFPNEFGAMLRGAPHISHIEPVLEGAGGRASFMFSLFDRLSQRAVQGEGVVHSHPSGSARPSKADLSMFSRFPGINLIIGYPFSEDSIAAYDRLGNRVRLRIEEDGS